MSTSTSTSTSTIPTWLVTGTSSGLGLSLSQHILKQGHNLISISRHPEPDASLVALSNSSKSNTNTNGGTLTHIPLDLSNADPTPLKSAIHTFLQSGTSTIDILVNNAAITLHDAIEHVSPEHIQHVMNTNFYSPVYLIQSVLPQMRQTSTVGGRPKVIINISSTQGLCTDPSSLSYDASKHAMEAMSGVLAAEVAMFGVRVLVVELGSLRTGFASAAEKRVRPQGQQSQQQQQKSGGDQTSQREANADADPYADPSHPVAKRKAGVMRYASEPRLARGDPAKTAGVLFDAVMGTEGSIVHGVLETQRKRTLEDAKKTGVERGLVERLVLGSDAQPKIERAVDRLRFDVESCREVSGLIEADG